MDKHNQKVQQVEDRNLQLEKQGSEAAQLQKQIQLLKHDLSLADAQISSKEDDLRHYKELYVDLQNRMKNESAVKQEEANRLRGQLEKHQDQLNYSHSVVSKLQSHIGSAEETEQTMKRTLRQRTEELDQASKRITELQNALREEISHNKELHEQIQSEIREKEQLNAGNTNRLSMVQEKLESLQATLLETQDQLQEYQDAEVHIRAALRQKEDVIRRHGQEIVELQGQSAQLTNENELLRQKKNEDLLQFQDKFQQASAILEQEVNSLKDIAQQKSQQINTLKDQLQQAQIQINDLATDRMRLENNLGEQSAVDGQLQRQLAQIQQALHEKEHECNLLKLKLQNSLDQTKRLESELEVFRNLGAHKDADVNRLSNTVTGLTKRLKEQVQLLVDKDTVRSSTPGATAATRSSSANNPLGSPRSPSRPYADILDDVMYRPTYRSDVASPTTASRTTANNPYAKKFTSDNPVLSSYAVPTSIVPPSSTLTTTVNATTSRPGTAGATNISPRRPTTPSRNVAFSGSS